MMSGTFKFTIEIIESLPQPAGRVYHRDPSVPNLELVQTKTGALRWYFRGRYLGKPLRMALGAYPDLKPKAAVDAADKIRNAIKNHEDPFKALEKPTRRRAGDTLAAFWQTYLDDYAKENRKNWEAADKDFANYFEPLAGYKLSEISPAMVYNWHRDLGKSSGEASANKQANLLRAIFAKAMRWTAPNGRKYASMNPATAEYVTRFTEEGRDRFITAEEIPAFWNVLNASDNPDREHFFKMALYTGQRKTNLMHMALDNIDLANQVWTIPREQFKGGKGKRHPHPVPLIDDACRIIEVRKNMLGRKYVFPGRRANGRPIGNVNFWWSAIAEEAGIPDVTVHDIRRTLATWMAMTGASYPIIAQLLGHALPGATAIYTRMAVGPVRDAVQVAVDAMRAAGGTTEDNQ